MTLYLFLELLIATLEEIDTVLDAYFEPSAKSTILSVRNQKRTRELQIRPKINTVRAYWDTSDQ